MTDTRERILDAATRVFGRDGVSGATTREIARAARVNEVTLFRSFKSKAELLRAVVTRNRFRYEDVFAEAPFATAAELRRTIQTYAAVYAQTLQKKEEFLRTFIGELNRQPQLCQRLFTESVKPTRAAFIAYLRSAQRKGVVRRPLDVAIAADTLTGMLMAWVIRRPLRPFDYQSGPYVKTCVEIFLRGILA